MFSPEEPGNDYWEFPTVTCTNCGVDFHSVQDDYMKAFICLGCSHKEPRLLEQYYLIEEE